MQLPPEPVLRDIVQRYARVVRDLGDEIGERPMVLPTGEFFPDPFERNDASFARLVRRMSAHAGMEDIPIDTRVVATETELGRGGGCGTGTCSVDEGGETEIPRLLEEGDGWVVQVPRAELGVPVVLTTNVARALGHVFVLETAEDDELVRELSVEAELAATALGLGALLLGGSYIYTKSCGGPSVAKVTKLSTAELAVAFALFAHHTGQSARRAVKHLDATQGALVSEADGWASSNPLIVSLMSSDPGRVVRGEFEVAESTPWLVRLFRGRGKRERPSVASALADPSTPIAEMEALVSSMPKERRTAGRRRHTEDDELRSLVEEALDEARSDVR